MKYFPDGISLDKAKALYRKLAKTMHPDVGGDTDEFAILANEYASLQVQQSDLNVPSYDDIMEPIRRKIALLTDFLNEVYPRTRISIFYSYANVDVYFCDVTPLPKMLAIEQLVHTFDFQCHITLFFRRGGSVKWYALKYAEPNVYHCNIVEGDTPVLTDLTPVYKGRRYNIWQNKRYAVAEDSKENVKIVMKRTPKFTLQELMGL